MINKNLKQFFETGKIKDYLDYKVKQKQDVEISKEISMGEKNETKRGNNC